MESLLHGANSDDAHTPVKVLGPGCDNWRKRDSGHAGHGLSLEEAKQRHRVRSYMSGGGGMAKTRSDTGGEETQAGDDGSRPSDSFLVHGLPIGELSLQAGQVLLLSRPSNIDANKAVQVGDRVSNT